MTFRPSLGLRALNHAATVALVFALLGAGATVALTIQTLHAYQWRGPFQYSTTVSATQSNTAVSFGFDAFDVLIVNDGSNEIFITFASSTSAATGSSAGFQINSGESFTMHLTSPVQGMGIICSSGETASVRVGAWR